MNIKPVINASDMCVCEQGIWFVHYVIPVLFFYDFKEEKITFAREIPCKVEYVCKPFSIEMAEGKIFIFPFMSTESYVYNIKEDCFKESKVADVKETNNFVNLYKYKNDICAIPCRYEKVARISCVSGEILYENAWKTEIGDEREEIYIKYAYRIDENTIVCVLNDSNYFLKYHINEAKWEKIVLQENYNNIGAIAGYNNLFYLYDLDSQRVLQVDSQGNVVRKSSTMGMETIVMHITCNGNLLIDSNSTDDIFILDETLSIKKKLDVKALRTNQSNPYLCSSWKNYASKTYAIAKSSELIIIDKDKIVKKTINIEVELWENLVKSFLKRKKNFVIAEDEIISLNFFLKAI